MKQCDYCGNYSEGLERVFIDCYYTNGDGETVDLCPEHLPNLSEMYSPCPDQNYRDAMQAHQAEIAEHINDEIDYE